MTDKSQSDFLRWKQVTLSWFYGKVLVFALVLLLINSLPAHAVGCTLNETGWTVFTPTPVVGSTPTERKSLTQYGSRIYYISAISGDDATGKIYFWDGTSIIDENGSTLDENGSPYGNDPMNPSGVIKPFRRWAWVGPRRNGAYDIGSNALPGEARPATRAGYPDWFLFHRGETYDLLDDIVTFWQEKNPSYAGNGSDLTSSLSLSAGRSSTERKLMSAYGDPCGARPRFIHPAASGFLSIFATAYDALVNNIAYSSLHFDGHDRLAVGTYTGISFLGQTTDSNDILFEDFWSDGISNSIQNEATVTFRRSLITDAFGTGGGHVQGLFYGGTGLGGRLRIEESILMRNGFRNQDPQTFSWPPTGANSWDIYDRNMYISGKNDPGGSWFRDSVSMMGASGDQFRGGRLVERNFFYQGYVNMGGYNGAYYATPDLSTGNFVDNVLQNFIGTGTNDNRGHPGWGLTLAGGSTNVEVTRNIFTNAATAVDNTWRSFGFSPSSTDCVAGSTNLKAPNKGNTIHNNIFDSGIAASAIVLSEGVSDSDQVCLQMTLPSMVGNIIRDNTLINSNLNEHVYETTAMATSTPSDTVFSNNTLYHTRAEAATGLGWSGPDRTLKTYMQSQGVTVTSADGFPEYFSQGVQMRKGYWDTRWTAKSINNYFRAGFGMSALSVDPDTTAPVLAEVTGVVTPTTDTTPEYVFHTTESGTITYGGDCTASSTTAIGGDNTITFSTLAVGTYSNCTVTVTDTANNASTALPVSSFTITAPVTPVVVSSSDSSSHKSSSKKKKRRCQGRSSIILEKRSLRTSR